MMVAARQPWVQFVVFGAAILAIDSIFGVRMPTAASDPLVVNVDASVRAAIDERLVASHGRAPSEEERAAAVERWVREEVLVREARALGLDRVDDRVRARLVETMVYVHHAVQVPPEPSDEMLRALFAKEYDRYEVPSKWSLRQLYAGDDRALAERLWQRWRDGEDPSAMASDAMAPPGGPVLRGRTDARLEEQLGASFVRDLVRLEEAPAILRSDLGWHVIQVLSHQEAQAPTFEAVRDRVAQRWRVRWTQQASQQATDALLERYEVNGWP